MTNQTAAQRPDQRLAQSYRFNDPDMDLFFMAALGWGPSGGLDIGQAHYVANQIADGDADSWVRAFSAYGDAQNAQADQWKARGWSRAAGEARLKAFAAYRSSWQFAPLGPTFQALYQKHQQAFHLAMNELALPATFFEAPYHDKSLQGVFFQNADPQAPVVLVAGGVDTCFEDLFLSVGRNLLDRGYSVALADLPGQGNAAERGLTWVPEAEQPIGAIIDMLKTRFAGNGQPIILLGLSLGGYFAARAAGHEMRLAATIASTPFPNPGELFTLAIEHGAQAKTQPNPNSATARGRAIMLWKSGASDFLSLMALTNRMAADPARVTMPFLSIVGGGDSPIFRRQGETWHAAIASKRKDYVLLDASTGADGHCQVNNRLRLAQECVGWLNETLKR